MQTEEQKTGEAWERGYGRQSNNVTQVVVCSLIPRLQANEAKLIHTVCSLIPRLQANEAKLIHTKWFVASFPDYRLMRLS